MTRKLNEAKLKQIEKTLVEKFGDPIAGVQLPRLVEASMCEACGCMKDDMDESATCNQCGMMQDELY